MLFGIINKIVGHNLGSQKMYAIGQLNAKITFIKQNNKKLKKKTSHTKQVSVARDQTIKTAPFLCLGAINEWALNNTHTHP